MRELTFVVPSDFDGAKLKTFLRGSCKVSAGMLTRLKWVYNGITVNGEHAHVIRIIHTGDTVVLKLPEQETSVIPEPIPLSVLFEDDDLLILNKPWGMAMYPTPGNDSGSLANAAAFHAKQRGEIFSLHPVYRLDKNTSGIVVLAKHGYAASALAFCVQKTYWAVCEGFLEGSGTIDQPIRLVEGRGIQREVGDGPGSQRAVTHWTAVSHSPHNHTLLRIQLETGRTHQIRVHFSSIGHPLAGDDFYGGSRKWIQRQALHCGEASFVHPVTNETIHFSQPMPADMQRLLKGESTCL